MDTLYAIELTDHDDYEIIEPFLDIVTSFIECTSNFYIFSSAGDTKYIINELLPFSIVESEHILYRLINPTIWGRIEDYGFQTDASTFYLLQEMVIPFEVIEGLQENKQMALLQFDEHLIAQEGSTYFVDVHHQALIKNIAKAYDITILF